MILQRQGVAIQASSIATWRKNTPIMATSNYGFPTLLTRKKLKELRDIIVNKELLRQYFDKIYDKIIAG